MGDLNQPWQPIAQVRLRYEKWTAHTLLMLVDSGSDISVIGLSNGQLLGFRHEPDEDIVTLRGIGGTVEGLRRNVTMIIAGHTFDAPILWAQDDNVPTVFGREIVFDLFDIEFCQADRRVLFRWRRRFFTLSQRRRSGGAEM